MTTLSQLETVQKKIDGLDAKMLKIEAALAATPSGSDIHFLRKQLERLHKEKIVRCEQETILLQNQATSEQCLPRYLLPSSCQLHAHLLDVLILSRVRPLGGCCQAYTWYKVSCCDCSS